MVNSPRLRVLLLMLSITLPAFGELRIFGSAGAESQFLRVNERSPLNPGNVAAIERQTNVADAVAFVDFTSAKRTWKLHAKVRVEGSDDGSDTGRIGEAYLTRRRGENFELTVGRVIDRWGTGYGWTPTAFVGAAKNPSDPNDRRSTTAGTDMLRATLFARGTTLSLYALDGGAAALRVYRLVRDTDVALVAHHADGVTREGVSAARVFGDALELHAEVAHRHGDTTPSTEILAGGQITFFSTNIVAEVHHSTGAPSANDWHRFTQNVDLALATHDAHALRNANREYAPLRMARTYAFTRVARTIGKTDLELIAIASMRDHSAIVRATVTRRVGERLSLHVIHTMFPGGPDSEMGYLQISGATAAGMRISY